MHCTTCGIDVAKHWSIPARYDAHPNGSVMPITHADTLPLMLQAPPRRSPVGRESADATGFCGWPKEEKIVGMDASESATLWSDEQHRGGDAAPIPWEQAYLRTVRD